MTQVGDLRNQAESREAELKFKAQELEVLNKNLVGAKLEHELVQEKAQKSLNSLDQAHDCVDELKARVQGLTSEIDTVKATHLNESLTIQANAKQIFENTQFQAFSKFYLN